MADSLITKFAKKSGKSEEEVSKLFDEAKEEAKGQFKDFNPKFWAYVATVVKGKLGIKESLKFSEVMLASKGK